MKDDPYTSPWFNRLHNSWSQNFRRRLREYLNRAR